MSRGSAASSRAGATQLSFYARSFQEIFKTLEVKEFEQPDGIVRLSVCNKSGLRPNSDCSDAGTVISDYFIADLAPTKTCSMHEDGFYNRPPYITTDERWSDKGGAGRGPEDAAEMPSSEDAFGVFGQRDPPTVQRCLMSGDYPFRLPRCALPGQISE